MSQIQWPWPWGGVGPISKAIETNRQRMFFSTEEAERQMEDAMARRQNVKRFYGSNGVEIASPEESFRRVALAVLPGLAARGLQPTEAAIMARQYAEAFLKEFPEEQKAQS